MSSSADRLLSVFYPRYKQLKQGHVADSVTFGQRNIFMLVQTPMDEVPELELADVPQEVFLEGILPYADFRLQYVYRNALPQIRALYRQRIGAAQDLIEQFLTAIDNDDVDLYRQLVTSPAYRDNPLYERWKDQVSHLLLNAIVQPAEGRPVPQRLFEFLLGRGVRTSTRNHLGGDLDLINQYVRTPLAARLLGC